MEETQVHGGKKQVYSGNLHRYMEEIYRYRHSEKRHRYGKMAELRRYKNVKYTGSDTLIF